MSQGCIAATRRQFTFNHQVPINSGYSLTSERWKTESIKEQTIAAERRTPGFLSQLFPMCSFSNPWKHQKALRCIGNKGVNAAIWPPGDCSLWALHLTHRHSLCSSSCSRISDLFNELCPKKLYLSKRWLTGSTPLVIYLTQRLNEYFHTKLQNTVSL